MADFDLGYFYYEHDKNQEAKELEQNGTSMINTGALVAVIGIILSIVFTWRLMLIPLIGAFLVYYGTRKHAIVEKIHEEQLKADHDYHVELHHEPNQFSQEISQHHIERSRIAELIKSDSGISISDAYKNYRSKGGTLDPEHFVKAVHALNRHGMLKVQKAISQTSRIPASST